MTRILMIIDMRTTLTVDDELMHTARRRAAEQHLSLMEVINRALRCGLAHDTTSRLGEATVIYGDPQMRGPDDAELSRWSQRLDDDELRRKA